MRYLELAAELRRQRFGPESLPVAASLKNLARVWRAQGRFAEAIDLYEQGLAIRKKFLVENTPTWRDFAQSGTDLVGPRRAQLARALALCQRRDREFCGRSQTESRG